MCISCEHPQCGICQSCHAGISEARAIFRQHGIQMHRTAALFHPGCQARVYRGILHLILGRVSDLRRKAHRKCVYLFRTLSFPVLYCVMHGHGRTDLTWGFFFFCRFGGVFYGGQGAGEGFFSGPIYVLRLQRSDPTRFTWLNNKQVRALRSGLYPPLFPPCPFLPHASDAASPPGCVFGR